MSHFDKNAEDRLGKIVALAKGGIRGEKDAALRMVKALCKQYDLNFDDVMSAEEKKMSFTIKCRRDEYRVLTQVAVRFAYGGKKGDIYHNGRHTAVTFETTQALGVETLNAWSVLSRLYRKEMEKVKLAAFHGFLTKHELYYQRDADDDEPQEELTEEEMRARRMGQSLAEEMEDAKLFNALKGK